MIEDKQSTLQLGDHGGPFLFMSAVMKIKSHLEQNKFNFTESDQSRYLHLLFRMLLSHQLKKKSV